MIEADATYRQPRRQIVWLFDHEFITPTRQKLERDVQELVADGFTNVVLCVTEQDIASRRRQAYLKEAVGYMALNGLAVWGDLWHVGGVFGGEARSMFVESGEEQCLDNPKLDQLVMAGITTVKEVGIDTIFWDEPEMKCADHRGQDRLFLEKYIVRADEEAGIKSVVCQCADSTKRQQIIEFAANPHVIEIATDPYWPNAFADKTLPYSERLKYFIRWASFIKDTAAEAGKQAHIWHQTFGIPRGHEAMITEFIMAAKMVGIDSAIWAHHGCESVNMPGFLKPDNVPPLSAWRIAVAALARPDTSRHFDVSAQ